MTTTSPPDPPDAVEVVFQTALLTLRRSLRGKRWILAVLLAVLPAVIGHLSTRRAHDDGERMTSYYETLAFLHFGICIPAVALSFATAFPWQDADDGALVWWFAAPVPRFAIHLGRWAAALAFGIVLLPASVFLLAWSVRVSSGSELSAVTGAAVAATALAYPAYLGLFWLVTTFSRKGLVLGIVYVLLESFLTALEGNVAKLTVIHYVRSLLAPAIPTTSGFAAASLTPGLAPTSASTSAIVLAAAAATTLGLSLWLVQRIEYRGKSSQAN